MRRSWNIYRQQLVDKKCRRRQKLWGQPGRLSVAKRESIGRFNIVFYIPQTKQFINLDHGRGKGLTEAGTVVETAPVAEATPVMPGA